MPVPRLFCPTLTEGTIRLSTDESHHAIASLRIKVGAEVVLFDGEGGEAVGQVRSVDRRRLDVDVTAITQHPFELLYRLTLAVAMPKAHRQGFLIEKCTELGVAEIWPIVADRSVTRPSTAAGAKWRRRAIEAAKQSRRSWVPQIAAPQTFDESIRRVEEFAAMTITDAEAAFPLQTFLAACPRSSSVLVWVGPAGGWSEAERALALEAGATPTKLSPTVLRTETAAVAVCAAVALLSSADAMTWSGFPSTRKE